MSQRQKARERRTAGFWAAKAKQARRPVDQAAVAWDRLRWTVFGLPDEDRDDAWRSVESQLGRIRSEVTERGVNSRRSHVDRRAA